MARQLSPTRNLREPHGYLVMSHGQSAPIATPNCLCFSNSICLTLPFDHTFGSGLIQLFYCVECDSAYKAFSATSLVRIVHPDHFDTTQVPPVASFPTKTIVDWASFDDFPNPQDHRKLGVDYIYGGLDPFEATVVSPDQGIEFTVLDDEELAEHISQAATGDKLSSWPHWIQGADYPNCPRCKQQMQYIFQLDSEDHLPFLFGYLGTGHITQCPIHKEVVAFGWNAS